MDRKPSKALSATLSTSTIVVCGSGRTLFDDMRRLRAVIGRSEVMAINGAVYGLDEFEHLASLHHDMIPHWRTAKGLRNDCGTLSPAHRCTTHSNLGGPDVDRVWAVPIVGGSSALFGVQVALEHLGFDEVILCGVPMTDAGHFYDPPWRRSIRSPGSMEPWHHAKDLYPGCIHSMSGLTQELFGDG